MAVETAEPVHKATSSRLKFTICPDVFEMKRTVWEPPLAKALAFMLMKVYPGYEPSWVALALKRVVESIWALNTSSVPLPAGAAPI